MKVFCLLLDKLNFDISLTYVPGQIGLVFENLLWDIICISLLFSHYLFKCRDQQIYTISRSVLSDGAAMYLFSLLFEEMSEPD